MIEEYVREKEYVENRKPYWLFLDAQDELEWGLFNYFPEAHYKRAIDEAADEGVESWSTSLLDGMYQDEVNDQ